MGFHKRGACGTAENPPTGKIQGGELCAHGIFHQWAPATLRPQLAARLGSWLYARDFVS